jgi:hypothetical protein
VSERNKRVSDNERENAIHVSIQNREPLPDQSRNFSISSSTVIL